MKKGFTLVELLIVIAVLGVLAAGVVAAVNPLKRINQANDTKVKNDVGTIALAMNAYFSQIGSYPTVAQGQAQLVTNGDLKAQLAAPSGYSAYTIAVTPAGCAGTAASACTDIAIYGQLKSPTVAANVAWCYKSSTGTAVETTVALCTP